MNGVQTMGFMVKDKDNLGQWNLYEKKVRGRINYLSN